MDGGQVPERTDISDEHKWDLDSVYDSRDAWEADYEAVETYIERMADYEGQLLNDADTLHEALLLKDQIGRKIGLLSFYAKARKREDMRVSEYQEMSSRVSTLSSKSSQAKSFIEPEIQQAEPDQVADLIAEQPGLNVYERYLETVFDYADHTLPPEQEELISQIGEIVGNERDIHSNLMNADIRFPTVTTPDGDEVTVTHSNRTSLLEHENREFRREVYESFMDTVLQFEHTLASNYENAVKTKAVFADIRGFDSYRERALRSNDIPEDVYDNLVTIVKDHADAQRRKQDLLQHVLAVDELEPWDGYMPLSGETTDITYDEAVDHVLTALQPLGDDYVEAARRGLAEDGWADVYPNKGKRSGAFSWGTYDTKPFLFMNFEDDLSSMYTLAHELGHSMHTLLAGEEQPYQHAGYPIFSAEVASTTHEALLTAHLLNTVEDNAFRKNVVDQQIKNISGTLFTQTMFADFEHRAHQAVEAGEALTAKRLNGLYQDVYTEFNGNPPKAENGEKYWMVVPHFYRPYYVYQYATGISAALALSQQILDDDDPDAAERYKTFLRSGSRDYPLELLTEAGVDLRSPEPIEQAIEVYEQYLDEMEQLVGT